MNSGAPPKSRKTIELAGRQARLEGELSQVEANLGFASDLPSLQGPWMALAFASSHPFRACSDLREARLEGEPSQVEANLGFASDLPSLQGPWMALQA